MGLVQIYNSIGDAYQSAVEHACQLIPLYPIGDKAEPCHQKNIDGVIIYNVCVKKSCKLLRERNKNATSNPYWRIGMEVKSIMLMMIWMLLFMGMLLMVLK